MQRKSFGSMTCPIARSLERVGEWWSILILRDAFRGLTRFDQFQKSLDIAPNMLTRRLNALVESGLLERRAYSEHPPRHEYVLTERGRDFRPVLWSLLAWGNRHFAPEGASVIVVDTETGEPADPVLVDRRTGKVMVEPAFRSVPGASGRQERVMSAQVARARDRRPAAGAACKPLAQAARARRRGAAARHRCRLVRPPLVDRRTLHREHRRCLCRRRRHGDRAEGGRLHRRRRGHRQPGGPRRRSAGEAG